MSANTSVAGKYVCEVCERQKTRAVKPVDFLSPPPCPECGALYELREMWIRGQKQKQRVQRKLL